MEFEFDPAKSESNRQKHGMDFIEAQQLWDDPKRCLVRGTFTDEPRSLLIAGLSGKLWTAALTYRDRKSALYPSDGRGRRRSRDMKAAEFDARFDAGEDAFDLAEWVRDPGSDHHLDLVFPRPIMTSLHKQSQRLGLSSHDLVRQWVSERLATLAE